MILVRVKRLWLVCQLKNLSPEVTLKGASVVVPGSLIEQWQDELGEKFDPEFDILTRDMIESSRSGNPF